MRKVEEDVQLKLKGQLHSILAGEWSLSGDKNESNPVVPPGQAPLEIFVTPLNGSLPLKDKREYT